MIAAVGGRLEGEQPILMFDNVQSAAMALRILSGEKAIESAGSALVRRFRDLR